MADNDRARSAAEHDDSDLIEKIEPAPEQQGRSGGNLAKDVSTQASRERVRDPEAREGVDKADDIAHATRTPINKRPDMSSGTAGD